MFRPRMPRSLRVAAALLALASGLVGCGGTQPADEDELSAQAAEAAVSAYRALQQGDYAHFVGAMQSVADKPAAYREQMVTLVKQHAVQQREQYGSLTSVSVQRTELAASRRAARVFLNLAYADGRSEEVVVSMVLAADDWQMR